MPVRLPIEGPYLAVAVTGMQFPPRTDGRHVLSPFTTIPSRLLRTWTEWSVPGHVFTRDHGPVTVLSPGMLSGSNVQERKVQDSNQVTVPLAQAGIAARRYVRKAPLCFVDWEGGNSAVLALPELVAVRLGSVATAEIGVANSSAIHGFANDVLACAIRHTVSLDFSQLSLRPNEVAEAAFPELGY